MQTEKNLDCQARQRLELLFDDGEYTEIGSYAKEKDNLSGVITAFGCVNGNTVYAFSQDRTVENGALGTVQAEKIAKIYDLAAKTGCPVVGIHDSDGAFVDGSSKALSAYGNILRAAAAVSGVVPQIAVIAGPCTGAQVLLASNADFIVLSKEKGEFASSSLDEKADSEKLVSIVAKDEEEAFKKTRDLINLLPVNNLAGAPLFNAEAPETEYTGDFAGIANAVADKGSLIEIAEKSGKAAFTALATIGGTSTGIVATDKTNDKLTAEDADKISGFVRTCDSFNIPVVTFVNTEGFEKGNAGTVKAIARLAASYSEATTPKISIVTGKAVSTAFLALAGKNANADFTYAFESSSVSPMEPLAAVEFLWHDKLAGAKDLTAKRNELADEYTRTLASAESAANNGAVDDIIEPADTRKVIIASLDVLSGKREQNLPKKHNNIPL